MSSAERPVDPATGERQRLAQDLLREAVFQARARQAVGSELGQGLESGGAGACGLGAPQSSEVELSSRGQELLRELWLRPLAPTEVAHIQGTIQGWIERQDAFDRKRNHFLRDFRQVHGYDRRIYPAEIAQAFEDGLARINAEAEERLLEAARELLSGV